ncbi:MAG: ATP-binding cassette domain-containing protein, partial [Alcaligenaceae bacterium]|nr:ATP-binding cassette domain-containing protein [Alcaligenaceae bacterium]
MIEFINCSKQYPNGTKALNNVNLKIEQGEMVAIIGLSGAGKSTLIRCINQMIPITSGECLVDGTDVSKLKGIG